MAKQIFDWQRTLAKSNQRELMRLVQASDIEMQQAMLKSLKQIDGYIAKIPSNTFSGALRRQMYIGQKAAIGESITSLWENDIDVTTLSNIRKASDLAIDSNKTMLSFLMKASPSKALTPELARSMYASEIGTWRNLQSRFINDIDLSPNIYTNQVLMSGKIDDIVNGSILAGRSAAEIAKDVEGYINPKVMGGAKYAATRLGRTELNNSFHETSRRTYAESPYVEAVKWYLSGSHPRPDQCNAYAEEDNFNLGAGVYKPTEVPDKPHPQCFCFIAPITPTPKQFVDNLVNGQYDDRMNAGGLAQSAMCG